MRSPKLERGRSADLSESALHRYYAGFSASFVDDALNAYATETTRVLDPWNGSGTTTEVCARKGIRSVGIDINPATLPLAWARQVEPSVARQYLREVADLLSNRLLQSAAVPDELTCQYFEDSAANKIQSLRAALLSRVTNLSNRLALQDNDRHALAGLAITLVARLLSDLMAPLRTTNPSWFCRPRAPSSRLRPEDEEVIRVLTAVVEDAENSFSARPVRNGNFHWPDLLLGDARAYPTSLGTFDLIVTSPPYCTRIDYAIATTPEILAFGGMTSSDVERLRVAMIGSVLTTRESTGVSVRIEF